MPDGSLKSVECDVLQRMAFKVFTARDPTTAPANCRTAVLDRTSCPHGVTRLECPRRAMGFFRDYRRESDVPSGTDVDRLGRYLRKVPATEVTALIHCARERGICLASADLLYATSATFRNAFTSVRSSLPSIPHRIL